MVVWHQKGECWCFGYPVGCRAFCGPCSSAGRVSGHGKSLVLTAPCGRNGFPFQGRPHSSAGSFRAFCSRLLVPGLSLCLSGLADSVGSGASIGAVTYRHSAKGAVIETRLLWSGYPSPLSGNSYFIVAEVLEPESTTGPLLSDKPYGRGTVKSTRSAGRQAADS